METITITSEQLKQLQNLYPDLAQYGSSTLLTYVIARHCYQVERTNCQPVLPVIYRG